MCKEELEELYRQGKCFATQTEEGTYYAFSFMKDEHVFLVLSEAADIDWYKTEVLDLIIVESMMKTAENGPVRFHEQEKPVSFNRSCIFKTEHLIYRVFMNICNL